MDTKQLSVPVRMDYYLHCAGTWATILQELNVQSMRIIYDLCPGWSTKIELALLQTNFTGTIYCIDKSDTALRIHKQYESILKTNYSVCYKTFDILANTFQSNPCIPKPSLIIANHILDDILLGAFAETRNIQSTDLLKHPENLSTVWAEILHDTKLVVHALNRVYTFIDTFLVPDGKLLITQYPSYQDNLYKSSAASNFHTLLLHQILTIFLKNNKYSANQQEIFNIFLHLKHPYFKAEHILFLTKQTLTL
jgi:hypothetical protein